MVICYHLNKNNSIWVIQLYNNLKKCYGIHLLYTHTDRNAIFLWVWGGSHIGVQSHMKQHQRLQLWLPQPTPRPDGIVNSTDSQDCLRACLCVCGCHKSRNSFKLYIGPCKLVFCVIMFDMNLYILSILPPLIQNLLLFQNIGLTILLGAKPPFVVAALRLRCVCSNCCVTKRYHTSSVRALVIDDSCGQQH